MSSNLYVKLDASYHEDEKILLAGEKAELLYIRGLCLAKRILSDGFVADVHLPRFGLAGVNARAKKLVEVGLWVRDQEAKGYWIVAWTRWNASKDEVEAMKEGGVRGNHVRWHVGKRRPSPECPLCVEEGRVAPPSPPESGGESGGESPQGIPEAEAEAEAEAVLPGAADATRESPPEADPVTVAVADVCGIDRSSLTESGAGQLKRAVKEIRDAGGTPEQVPRRAAEYRQRWSDAALTPSALAKHWPGLDPGHAPAAADLQERRVTAARNWAAQLAGHLDRRAAIERIGSEYPDPALSAAAIEAYDQAAQAEVHA